MGREPLQLIFSPDAMPRPHTAERNDRSLSRTFVVRSTEFVGNDCRSLAYSEKRKPFMNKKRIKERSFLEGRGDRWCQIGDRCVDMCLEPVNRPKQSRGAESLLRKAGRNDLGLVRPWLFSGAKRPTKVAWKVEVGSHEG